MRANRASPIVTTANAVSCPSVMRYVLCVMFGLSLACSAERAPTPTQTEPAASAPEPPAKPAKRPDFDQSAPLVGDPAPPISLATLTGSQVLLPMSNADRAAVLIFGSFS